MIKTLKNIVTLGDVVVILFLVALSFLPFFYFQMAYAYDENAIITAYVSIDGEVVDTFILDEDTPHQEITYYPNEGQYNIVEIDGPKIRVKEDNSPDQVAVRTGWIDRPGQTSICLPFRLIIEIRSSEGFDDSIIISG